MKSSISFRTKGVVFCGIFAALSFVFMFVGTLTGVLDLTAMVVSSLAVSFMVIEFGGMYPWSLWIVGSALCLLLLPDKFAALEYALFGGIYPIVKSYVERLPKIPSWAIKLVFFNAVLTAAYFAAVYLFHTDSGMTIGVITYIAANVFFVIYDIALTVFISFYIKTLRRRLKINFNQ